MQLWTLDGRRPRNNGDALRTPHGSWWLCVHSRLVRSLYTMAKTCCSTSPHTAARNLFALAGWTHPKPASEPTTHLRCRALQCVLCELCLVMHSSRVSSSLSLTNSPMPPPFIPTPAPACSSDMSTQVNKYRLSGPQRVMCLAFLCRTLHVSPSTSYLVYYNALSMSQPAILDCMLSSTYNPTSS